MRIKPASANLKGIFWVLVSSFNFAIVAAIVKAAGQELHSFQVVFFRCLFGLFWLLPVVVRLGLGRTFHTHRFGLHLSRALLGILAMGTTFYAYIALPMADVTALSFASPLFMIVLAVLFLREKVCWPRWLATLIGFGGVLLMTAPGLLHWQTPILAAACSPFLVALVQTSVKRLTQSETTLTIVAFFTLNATLITAIPAFWVWKTPSMTMLLAMVLCSGVATLAQTAMVRAYAVGEATVISPFYYVQLIFNGGIGFVFFAERPTMATFLGALVIVASTFYLVRQEMPQNP